MRIEKIMVLAFFGIVALLQFAVADGEAKEVYPCRRIVAPLQIDGELDDWWSHKPHALALVHPDNIAIPDRRGPEDLDVVCYMLWDEDAFYLAAEITDDRHVAWFNSTLWMADSFQIAFDPKDDSVNEPRFGPDDIEINFTATDDGGSYTDISAHGDAKLLGEVSADRMRVCYKRNEDDTGGTMEVAMPWELLRPIDPKPDSLFGFNVLYNERDDDMRRGWVHWTSGIAEMKNAWFFNKVKLVDGAAGAGSQPFATASRRYFKEGDAAEVFCYVPYYDTDLPDARFLFNVADNGDSVYSERKQLKLRQGMNRVGFAFKSEGDARLFAEIGIRSSGLPEPVVLTVPLKSFAAGALLERAEAVQERYDGLRSLLAEARKKGVAVDYPQATAGVVGLFLKHRVADLKDEERLRRYEYLDAVEEQLSYLDGAVTRTVDEVKQLMAAPGSAKPIPAVDTTTIAIREGQFRDANDRPVMLLGPAGWHYAFQDIEFYRDMGFNLIGDTMTPGEVAPSPGKYLVGYIDGKKRHARQAMENNMALHFLCSPHPVPEEWLKAYPDMKGGNGFINASYYGKGFKEMVRQYWSRLVPALRDEPALATWNVANEWFNYEGTRSVHPEMRVRFHNFLREKYRDIGALNKKWRTSYKSLNEIQPLEFHRQSEPGPYYDWEYFRQGEGLNVVKFFADTIRRHDAVTPVQIKIIADTDFGGGPFGRVGVEREDADDVMDIGGLDVGTAANFNLLKSLHPDRPTMETEVHTSIHLSPEAETLRLWHTYLAGQSGRVMWGCVNSYSAEMKACGAYLSIPWTMEAAARTGLDIRRLSNEIARFQQSIAAAEVGILYSPVSRILEGEHLHTAAKTFEATSKLDAPVRFISERQIKEGQLASLKLLVVPHAVFVHPETFKHVVGFAQAGGTVVVSGQSLTRDPYDSPYSADMLAAAGVRTVDNRMDAETFDALFDMAGVDRQLRILRADGQSKVAIETRILEDGNGILAYVVNNGPTQKLAFNFTCEGMVSRDLISGRELDHEFTVQPSSAMMIRVRWADEPEVVSGGGLSVELPLYTPENASKRRKLTKKEKEELADIREKLLKYPHNNCTGRDDLFAVDGLASWRDKESGYVWWSGAGGTLEAGKYKAFARVKADPSATGGVFNLCLVDQGKDEVLRQMPVVVQNTEYKELELGAFEYDKSYMLRLSDWSSPGLWVDYVYLVPVGE